MRPGALLPLLFLPIACTNTWDTYESSAYEAIHHPSEEAYLLHVRSLETLIGRGESPPPGLRIEHAYYLHLLGRTEEALQSLEREVEAYPESAKIVEALGRWIRGAERGPGPAEGSGGGSTDEGGTR